MKESFQVTVVSPLKISDVPIELPSWSSATVKAQSMTIYNSVTGETIARIDFRPFYKRWWCAIACWWGARMMRHSKAWTIYLILLPGLTSCSESVSTTQTIKTNKPLVTQYEIPYGIYEFRLTDGTRCVTVYKGGLACEWKSQQP